MWPHKLKHARLPCPSLFPWACSNSCPLSWWCHPNIQNISSSVVPFSSCPLFPSIRVFFSESALRIRWPKFGTSASASVLSVNIQGWYSLGVTDFNLLPVQGTLKSLLQHHNSKASILRHSAFFMVQLSHTYVTTGKTIALTRQTLVGKVMSLLFNMLPRFVLLSVVNILSESIDFYPSMSFNYHKSQQVVIKKKKAGEQFPPQIKWK